MRKIYIIIAVAAAVLIGIYLYARQEDKKRLLEDIRLQEEYVQVIKNAAYKPTGTKEDEAEFWRSQKRLDSLKKVYQSKYE